MRLEKTTHPCVLVVPPCPQQGWRGRFGHRRSGPNRANAALAQKAVSHSRAGLVTARKRREGSEGLEAKNMHCGWAQLDRGLVSSD